MFTPKRIYTVFGRSWFLTVLFSLLCFSIVLAASGDLDTTFSSDGKITMDFVSGQGSSIGDVAIQPDGKIVVVGSTATNSPTTRSNIAIARFTKTGTLDLTFNGTGKRVTNLGGNEEGLGVVINETTGKIIVAGQICGGPCDVTVLRYNKNGSLDTTFNTTGYRIDDFGGGENGSFGAVALQNDGKIVTGGYMFNTATGTNDFAVYRYTKTGSLDTTFNGTGKKSIPFANGNNDYIWAIAIHPTNGKIIAAGYTCDSSDTNCNFALARLNPNGTLDMSFNTNGKQTTNFGGDDKAYSVALQEDGKILLVGGKFIAATDTGNFALARYNPNGTLDTTFAGTGKKVFDFSGINKFNVAIAVNIQPSDGKIVVAGNYFCDNFVIARFNSNGTLDHTFSSDGKVSIEFGGSDVPRALAIQPADGKYVLGGYRFDGSMTHWALARVLP